MTQVNVHHNKPVMKPSSARTDAEHGERYLDRLVAVIVRLESGETLQFNRKAETWIPDDLDAQIREAKRAPARIAFWSYQMDRALRKVRELELEQKKTEGEWGLIARKYYQEETEERIVTDAMVRAQMYCRAEWQTVTARLNAARNTYDIMRTMVAALDHRCYILRRLIGRESPQET
jgi:hypothetical protein